MEAREAGRNRFFVTTDATQAAARQAIAQDISQLRRAGLSEPVLSEFLNRLLSGLPNQLFNNPLDMIIEHRLYHQHPMLRPSQFVSLYASQLENLKPLTDRDIKRLTPRLVYNANLTMNAAYALFMDHLYEGRTNYGDAWQGTRYYRDGRKLFVLWLEAMEDFRAGDEYQLVDQFATELRLEDWYLWQEDRELPPEEAGGSTNEELLRAKQPAAMMYCLSALRRFEKMDRDEILKFVSEIALLGQRGLDYASSDQKYTLASAPGERFSGLQLMSLMYVGFKDIDPTLDTGIDLDEAYRMALALYEGP